MGLLVYLEVLEVLEPKVRENDPNVLFLAHMRKGNPFQSIMWVYEDQHTLTLVFLQVCLDPLVWMDLMDLQGRKGSLEPQARPPLYSPNITVTCLCPRNSTRLNEHKSKR